MSPVSSGRVMTFFRSRWVDPPPGVQELDAAELAPGFRAGGVACGLRGDGATDLALLACDADHVASAMVLTSNAAAGAPVRVCRERCDLTSLAGAVVNSGNANAATGEVGYHDALAMRDAAAAALDLEPQRVAIAQTGVIGFPLDLDAVRNGITAAAGRLSPRGAGELADAILTTDRGRKACTVRADGVTISAQAKGAGMMQPNFATLLCFVQTDGRVDDPQAELRPGVADSFERITVDGQQSTNDAVLLQASGAAERPLPAGLLDAVLLQLALDVVADGEGASRIARVEAREAADEAEAEAVARAIANSPLVKASLYGRDPNWGRIAQATGMALAGEDLGELGGDAIDASGLGSGEPEADIVIRLGRGDASAQVYFSDLTPDYVKLNSEYTT